MKKNDKTCDQRNRQHSEATEHLKIALEKMCLTMIPPSRFLGVLAASFDIDGIVWGPFLKQQCL